MINTEHTPYLDHVPVGLMADTINEIKKTENAGN